eukprot:8298744-Pyramimonas_sp.AAC.1
MVFYWSHTGNILGLSALGPTHVSLAAPTIGHVERTRQLRAEAVCLWLRKGCKTGVKTSVPATCPSMSRCRDGVRCDILMDLKWHLDLDGFGMASRSTRIMIRATS